jgi:uncharacterized protein DUF6923
MRRIVPIAIALAIPLAALGSVPATAAPVDPADDFIVAEFNDDGLYSVDPSTGVSTLLGNTGVDEVTGIDVDYATGEGYAVTWGDEGVSELYSVDAANGTLTLIDPINDGDEYLYSDCTGLDFSLLHVLTVTCGDPEAGYVIGSVDPLTAVLTPIVSQSPARFSALASNPLDGTLYAIEYDSGPVGSQLYRVSGSSIVFLGEITVPESSSSIYAADFDGSGVLHVINESDETGDAQLGIVDLATLVLTPGADLVDENGDTFWSESLTVNGVPVPQLAATGTAVAVAPIGAAALLVLLFGGAALMLGRRHRMA